MSSTATTTDMAIKPEVVTYALQATQVSDGVDANGQPKYKTELKAISREKDIEAAKAKNEIVVEQSFSFYRAGSIAGIHQVVKDEEEAVNIFNGGLKQKLASKIKQLMESTDEEGNSDFQPVEGNYDATDLVNEPAQRRNLSPTDKAVKVLMGLGMSKEQAFSLVSATQISPAAETVNQ